MTTTELAIYCETLELMAQVIPQDLTAALYGDPLALEMFEADCERLAMLMIRLVKEERK